MSIIENKINQIINELIDFRHELHQYPELGLECHNTAKLILDQLEKIAGLQIRTGLAETGIIAILNAEKAGPGIALRADMDALPIQEETGLPYSSKIAGKMHACGHDGHTTCLLGAVKVLAEMKDQLAGPVVFIFQPGEEGFAGAKLMREQGALRDNPVNMIFGLHGWPQLELGHVATRAGTLMAGDDTFEITIRGKACHAAAPHTGIDPILIASHITVALQNIPARFTNPLDSIVVGISQFNAGTASNIIPDQADLAGTLRSLLPETRKHSKELIVKITNNIAESLGGKASIKFGEFAYPATINESNSVEYFNQVATKAFGGDKVNCDYLPVMTAEDFSFFLEETPGAYWFLGLKPEEQTEVHPLHSPYFNFPDAAIAKGVRLHCELALNLDQRAA